ncbi:leucine-rich repeat-containing protein 69-like [Aphis craccivora]|uniref:Leucine-rich repeat-containing protein 69-like n=1 Tax=Aphis craccivora TaxID=307492 RepID=A0A6G0Z614_APHCR|nr:leucine-rich repeat-containing protein 69-like [Aphis craccivora]
MTLNDWTHIVNVEYKFDMGSFSCLKRYDFESTKNNITNLILDNVNVSSLKGLTTMSHIKCICLSGSTFGRTPFEKDTLWNWMNYPNVDDSLTVLLLDSINLTEVPFELQYLSKLKRH